MKFPLSVAIAALIHNNKILMIKRAKGSYSGLWGFPGGKIEFDEHVSEAAVREIFEETGIESEFKKHLGFVSEHLMEDKKIIRHFLLHICELNPKNTEFVEGCEGELAWFDLDNISRVKEHLIPSDFLIINNLIKNSGSTYYNCVIEKSGDFHVLKKFE